MAKTRAQPFGNFDTSGALAGIQAVIRGGETVAAMRQRDKENLLGVVERTATGVANRKLAREDMAAREEEWRTKLAEQSRQFGLSLAERRSEREQDQSWREKLFQYGADRDVTRDQMEMQERFSVLQQAQQARARADAIRSIELGRGSVLEMKQILATAGEAVVQGNMSREAYSQLEANLQPRYQGALASLRSRLQEVGMSEQEAMSEGLPLRVISELYAAQAQAAMEQVAPEAVVASDEAYRSAVERLLTLEQIPAGKMSNRDRVELARLKVRTSEYEQQKKDASAPMIRQAAKEFIGESIVNDPTLTPEERQAVAQIAMGSFGMIDTEDPSRIRSIIDDVRQQAERAVGGLRSQREAAEKGAENRKERSRRHESALAKAELDTEAWASEQRTPPTEEERRRHLLLEQQEESGYDPQVGMERNEAAIERAKRATEAWAREQRTMPSVEERQQHFLLELQEDADYDPSLGRSR